MDNLTGAKVIIGAVGAVLGYLYNCFNVVVVILAGLMIFDYLTGTTLAIKEGKWNIKEGVWGAIKKLFYFMIVATGFLLDYAIRSAATQVEFNLDTKGAIGIAVTLYLIGNEGVSLAKNWTALGLPSPAFLQKAFGYMKNEAGKLVKIPEATPEANTNTITEVYKSAVSPSGGASFSCQMQCPFIAGRGETSATSDNQSDPTGSP